MTQCSLLSHISALLSELKFFVDSSWLSWLPVGVLSGPQGITVNIPPASLLKSDVLQSQVISVAARIRVSCLLYFCDGKALLQPAVPWTSSVLPKVMFGHLQYSCSLHVLSPAAPQEGFPLCESTKMWWNRVSCPAFLCLPVYAVRTGGGSACLLSNYGNEERCSPQSLRVVMKALHPAALQKQCRSCSLEISHNRKPEHCVDNVFIFIFFMAWWIYQGT